MKNRTPTPPAGDAPRPAFAPVPRVKPRHDGWTPDRQRAFVGALADTGSVSRAAALVNMSTESAYQLRRQPGAESFRRAWEAALDFGALRLKDIAMDRAITGQLVPQREGGRIVGYLRKFDNRLLMSLIRLNERSAEQRRRGGRGETAEHTLPAAPGTRRAASLTAPVPTRAEADDDRAHRLDGFVPVPLSDAERARGVAALAADAAARAALSPLDDPAADALSPDELETPGDTPLESGVEDAAPRFAEGEASWHRLHDEAALQAIDDAVASVEAAKREGRLARALLAPPRNAEADRAPNPQAEAAAAPDAQPAAAPPPQPASTPLLPKRPPDLPRRATGISPRTGKPVRAYKARMPKPPFTPILREGEKGGPS